MTPTRSADNLIWIDLEFTNLDPAAAYIMQAAMIVTTPDLVPIPPPGIPEEVGGLLFDVHLSADQAATASDWVRQNQAEQLRRSQGEEAVPVDRVEELFVAYLLTACEVPASKRDRPLLCGNSVHGDYRFICRHMPQLENLLSFRLLDVTTLKEIARRWCPDLEYRKTDDTIKEWYPGRVALEGEAHDALYDIKGSIAELNYYRHRLFADPARRGAVAPPGRSM
ncbi:MAG: oligoribonuclease [Planctomycetes bacterium]|nr:oligoribonuclease [Planctomycetota bacterium]